MSSFEDDANTRLMKNLIAYHADLFSKMDASNAEMIKQLHVVTFANSEINLSVSQLPAATKNMINSNLINSISVNATMSKNSEFVMNSLIQPVIKFLSGQYSGLFQQSSDKQEKNMHSLSRQYTAYSNMHKKLSSTYKMQSISSNSKILQLSIAEKGVNKAIESLSLLMGLEKQVFEHNSLRVAYQNVCLSSTQDLSTISRTIGCFLNKFYERLLCRDHDFIQFGNRQININFFDHVVPQGLNFDYQISTDEQINIGMLKTLGFTMDIVFKKQRDTSADRMKMHLYSGPDAEVIINLEKQLKASINNMNSAYFATINRLFVDIFNAVLLKKADFDNLVESLTVRLRYIEKQLRCRLIMTKELWLIKSLKHSLCDRGSRLLIELQATEYSRSILLENSSKSHVKISTSMLQQAEVSHSLLNVSLVAAYRLLHNFDLLNHSNAEKCPVSLKKVSYSKIVSFISSAASSSSGKKSASSGISATLDESICYLVQVLKQSGFLGELFRAAAHEDNDPSDMSIIQIQHALKSLLNVASKVALLLLHYILMRISDSFLMDFVNLLNSEVDNSQFSRSSSQVTLNLTYELSALTRIGSIPSTSGGEKEKASNSSIPVLNSNSKKNVIQNLLQAVKRMRGLS
ncbi:MAG: hypothetical protein MHMPM18_000360 [Marteilia pararefringens]